jgi:hypothetical protein
MPQRVAQSLTFGVIDMFGFAIARYNPSAHHQQ